MMHSVISIEDEVAVSVLFSQRSLSRYSSFYAYAHDEFGEGTDPY